MEMAEIFQQKWESAGSTEQLCTLGKLWYSLETCLGRKASRPMGAVELFTSLSRHFYHPCCASFQVEPFQRQRKWRSFHVLTDTHASTCCRELQPLFYLASLQAEEPFCAAQEPAKQQKYALRLKHALQLAALTKMHLLNYKGQKRFQNEVQICHHCEALNQDLFIFLKYVQLSHELSASLIGKNTFLCKRRLWFKGGSLACIIKEVIIYSGHNFPLFILER